MAAGIPRKVKVHYRRAVLEGGDEAASTLQQRLQTVMSSALGNDARKRIFDITEDKQHKACLNYHEVGAVAFLADVMHLDGRNALPTWLHPKNPEPVAKIIPRELGPDEASLGEPLYLLVKDNHVAAIERMGFRNTNLQVYLNALLKAGEQLDEGTHWKLVPKIEITGSERLAGPVKKVTFRPSAALVGDGPTVAPERKGGRPKYVSQRLGDIMAQGRRVIDMAVAAGADEAKIHKLQAQMSTDLALQARLEISVAKVRQNTKAMIDPDTVQQAFAELASQGDVLITSEDGRTNGKLIQLTHPTEVMETGGMIDWKHATQALVSALTAWGARDAIDLSS
ncbi:hypothetical protein [Brevundimonas diminuta]|nr:hypothetical protein [Brevundimonas diminuta]MDM8352181.1 hypothetical protein [Brevundimonas diminuta]